MNPEEYVRCPLKTWLNIHAQGCWQGVCAWWDHDGQCCVVCTATAALVSLSWAMNKILINEQRRGWPLAE